MLNEVVLVGRIVNDLVVNTDEKGEKWCVVKLAINRSYKNDEGLYDTDFIDVVLYDDVAIKTQEYCRKGDLVGVKARLNRLYNKDMEIVAYKMTFLSCNHNNIESEEE